MKLGFGSVQKYIPLGGLLYAIYSAYGTRGLQGLKDDIADIPNLLKSKNDLMELAIGIVLIVFGSRLVQKFVPAGALRMIAMAIVYVGGFNLVFDALQKGATTWSYGGYFGSGTTQGTAPTIQQRVG